MKNIIDILHQGNYSCVIEKKGEIRTFSQRGIADLYNLLTTDADFMKGASVADKVIGKAAASLLIIGEIEEIYADMISEAAIDILATRNIKLSYANKVPYIQNRDQTGWCPLESLTKEKDSLDDIFISIEKFIQKMSAK